MHSKKYPVRYDQNLVILTRLKDPTEGHPLPPSHSDPENQSKRKKIDQILVKPV